MPNLESLFSHVKLCVGKPFYFFPVAVAHCWITEELQQGNSLNQTLDFYSQVIVCLPRLQGFRHVLAQSLEVFNLLGHHLNVIKHFYPHNIAITFNCMVDILVQSVQLPHQREFLLCLDH